MTKYLDDDLRDIYEVPPHYSSTAASEQVIKGGWYLFHEDSIAELNDISVGRKRSLICSLQNMSVSQIKKLRRAAKGSSRPGGS